MMIDMRMPHIYVPRPGTGRPHARQVEILRSWSDLAAIAAGCVALFLLPMVLGARGFQLAHLKVLVPGLAIAGISWLCRWAARDVDAYDRRTESPPR